MNARIVWAASAAGILGIMLAVGVAAQGSSDETIIVGDLGLNEALQVRGAGYRFAYAEFVTDDTQAPFPGGQIIAFDRGNKELGHHFVPRDPRRGGSSAISYITDLFDGATTGGLTAAQTTVEINRAMATWDAPQCSTDLGLINSGAYLLDFGIVQKILGFGGSFTVFSDLTHAGWLPKAFFEALTPGGGDFILGVTFTFIFVDVFGNPSDIDGNGRLDVAFREIYYNNNFAWRTGPWTGGNDFDAFGVILHEAGHGLSQAHFGRVFRPASGTRVQSSPFAVMNAVVSRRTTHTELQGTDVGGHCANWGSWPNN